MGLSKEMQILSGEQDLQQQQTGLSFELSLLNSNKEQINDLAKSVIYEVSEGFKDPLQTLISCKKMQEFGKLVENNIKSYCSNKNLGKGGLTMFNANISEYKQPDTYDFTACNDSVWNDLKEQEKSIKDSIKKREEFLKTLTKPMADLETGEIINPADVVNGSQSVKVTLK